MMLMHQTSLANKYLAFVGIRNHSWSLFAQGEIQSLPCPGDPHRQLASNQTLINLGIKSEPCTDEDARELLTNALMGAHQMI